MLRSLLADFLALFFPDACLACQELLVAGETHLCTACRIELPYTDYHHLPPAQNPLSRRFWGACRCSMCLATCAFCATAAPSSCCTSSSTGASST